MGRPRHHAKHPATVRMSTGGRGKKDDERWRRRKKGAQRPREREGRGRPRRIARFTAGCGVDVPRRRRWARLPQHYNRKTKESLSGTAAAEDHSAGGAHLTSPTPHTLRHPALLYNGGRCAVVSLPAQNKHTIVRPRVGPTPGYLRFDTLLTGSWGPAYRNRPPRSGGRRGRTCGYPVCGPLSGHAAQTAKRSAPPAHSTQRR